MKRAAFSKPIYPADAYREDYEMLTGDGKTPAEDARDGVYAAAYVIALAFVSAFVLAGIAIAVVMDWMIFP